MIEKTIVLVGGGSGGHLTPLISVAIAIKNKNNSIKIVHIGQSNENLKDVLDSSSVFNDFFTIQAGKFRRYHGESFISHLLDFKTIFLNIRDFFKFLIGTIQAWFYLGKIKPDSIMLKGGFVCVPVGLAARLRKIPYITHDSDAIPGLANRITGSHAIYNTTALPADIYPYDKAKTIQVGIPLRPEFKKITDNDRKQARKKLRLKPEDIVLLIAGGGLGSQKLNLSIVKASSRLLKNNSISILHLTGKKLFNETSEAYSEILDLSQLERVKLIDFTTDPALYAQACDLVITRGGATNIAEFATLCLPCIVVPNPVLTGGQQLHNSNILLDNDAAIVIQESELDSIADIILDLFSDNSSENKRRQLAENLNALVSKNADEKLAELLIKVAYS